MDEAVSLRLLEMLVSAEDLPDEQTILRSANTPDVTPISLGRSFLFTFARLNILGPPSKSLSECDRRIPSKIRHAITDYLTVEGEPPFHLSVGLGLLMASRKILKYAHQETASKTSLLLLLKTIHVHQQLLSEKSPTLLKELLQLLDEGGSLICHGKEEIDLHLHLLANYLTQYYFEHSRATKLMEAAKEMVNIEVGLSGAPGKRTRFQKEDKSQLFLAVSRKESASNDGDCAGKDSDLPTNVALDDDTVLPKIAFQDATATDLPELSGDETAFLMALSVYHRQTTPMTEVAREEMLAYVQGILEQPQDWCTLSEALVMRSYLEKQKGRLVQRSIQQMEEMSNQFSREKPNFEFRAQRFLFSRMPTRWGVDLDYAELILSEGLVKAALEIFLRWEAWTSVINCHLMLGKTGAAERIIRQRLEESPNSVLLLCSLGDVTGEAEHYEKAWEVSGQRSARAMRSLAVLNARKGRYEESVPYFERSLAINPLHHGTAFSFGCAAMEAKLYDKAEGAFRRCTSMEPDDFQAWANLAAVLSKRGQKLAALKIQEEALRRNYENWRLWENFLVVATDAGAFGRVIDAFHRLVDLRGRHWDGPVIKVLVQAVNEDIADCHDQGAAILRPKLSELLGRLTSQGGLGEEVWRLYADLLRGEAATVKDLSKESRRKCLEMKQKSYTALVDGKERGKEGDIEVAKEASERLIEVAKFGLECSEEDEDCRAVLRSTRLSIKSLKAKMKKHHEDLLTGELVVELKDNGEELTRLLSEIENVLSG